MHKIHTLDPLVSSQIAAGEVVERPASVVKELMENALDAGASRIIIDFDFNDDGLAIIRVSDNGCGMSPEDAETAVQRFATSKLTTADDLNRISTLGFRGEALPSIASCSKVTLETQEVDASRGVKIKIEGGKVLSISEAALPFGTTVTVEDLFYNTPARLKFMKSRGTEKQAAADIAMRLALSWPNVSIVMRSGSNEILRTTGQGLKNALVDIFGAKEGGSMIEVRSSLGKVSVSGFIGLPSAYRRRRDRQIFSVNRRPVRDPSLGWALDDSFKGMLPPGSYAVAVLNISVAPEEVDVNVHPTKAEVKFRNGREVSVAVSQAVREALRDAGFSSFGFTDEVRRTSSTRPAPKTPFSGHPCMLDERWAGRPATGSSRQLVDRSTPPILRDLPSASAGQRSEAGSACLPPGWNYLGSIRDTYLVAASQESLFIVDKHALMESLVFLSLASGDYGSQDLLVSELVQLDPKEALVYEGVQEILEEVGFSSRLVGERTVMVTKVPFIVGKALEPGALKEVLDQMEPSVVTDAESKLKSVARSSLLRMVRAETAACHASVRAGEPLSPDEAGALLAELWRHPEARTCPHGRPVLKEILMRDLDAFFGRTSHGAPGQL